MIIQHVTYFLTFLGLSSLILVSVARGLNLQLKKFVVLVGAISIWLFLQWVSVLVNEETGIFLIEASVGFSSFVVIAFLEFIYEYSARVLKKSSLIVLTAISFCFLILSLLGRTVTEISVSEGAPSITDVTFLYWIQIGFVLAMALFAANTLRSRILHKRQPADSLLLVALIQALAFSVLTSTIFAASRDAQLLIPVSLLAMCVIIYYAIAKHKLFDVRLIVARTLGYLLSAASVVAVYAIVVVLVAELVFNDSVASSQILFFSLFSVITAFAFTPLKRFFDITTNRIFYRDAYDPETFLAEVNKVVVSDFDIDDLLQHVSGVIEQYLKPEFAIFELRQTAYVGRRQLGAGNGNYSSPNITRLEELLTGYHERVLTAFDAQESAPDAYKLLRPKNVAMIAKLAPFISEDTPGYGFLVLGSKKSGNQYTKQDINIVRIIAGELSIAVQNALRYEEIEQFNITLQDKVDDATKRLKKTNDKLKAMDETKDEFISMASHQLRTPLTSVKGYLSMVLEGDAGQLNDMQQKLLSQAFTSSQRMVFLIADLLNLSRLRTGKFIIEAQPTNLAELIAGEVSQLKETAAGRSLTLNYDKPETFPILMLDETKIRQVVMNFVDNAIYYTPAGGSIEIRLTETPKSVEFTVHDNGIGVPKAEQHHLFNKFYRAKNAQKARPDGTGLGLFMAKKVIVAQGGAIIFTSKESKGSTFGFSFSKEKLKPKV